MVWLLESEDKENLTMQDKFLEGELSKIQKIISQSGVAAVPLATIQYIGEEAAGTVAVAANGDFTLADSSGTILTIDVSDVLYDTMGELKAAVNASGVFRMILHCLPSASSNDTFATLTTASCRTDNGLTLYADMTTGIVAGFSISNEKFFSRPSGGFSAQQIGRTYDKSGKWNSECENVLNYLAITITAIGNGFVRYYSVDMETKVETLIKSDAFTSATQLEVGATLPLTPYVKANVGEALVVTMDRTTPGNDMTALVTQCLCSTKDMVGGHVEGANYTGCV